MAIGRGNKPATLRDIAIALGVTVTTVSKSIRNHPDVSTEMRRKVLAQVEKLNYTPNAAARSLRRSASTLIGMIITDISNPYFAQVIKGAEAAISSHQHHTVIFDNQEDPRRELELVRELRSLNVAGVIVTPAKCNSDGVDALRQANIPFVLANRYVDRDKDNYVVADDAQAAYLATDYLVRQRSNKVILVNGSEEISCARDRLSGYVKALKHHGIGIRKDRIYGDCNDQTAGYRAAQEIFAHHEPPFSILGYSDFVASGILRFALEAGAGVPSPVAIMGIDGIDLYSFTHPSLSTVDLPKQEIGRECANLLFRLIEETDDVKKRLVLEPQLVIRESA